MLARIARGGRVSGRRRLAVRYLAAQVILGELELDDIPEGLQKSVDWLITRCGPDRSTIGDPLEAIVGLMSRLENERR